MEDLYKIIYRKIYPSHEETELYKILKEIEIDMIKKLISKEIKKLGNS